MYDICYIFLFFLTTARLLLSLYWQVYIYVYVYMYTCTHVHVYVPHVTCVAT